MWAFILAPENAPFALALAVMLLFALLEILTLILGGSLFAGLDGLLPEMDTDLDGMGVFGCLPLFALVIFCLLLFGVIGLIVQDTAIRWSGSLLPRSVAAPLTALIVLPLLKGLNRALEGWVPREETSAICRDALIGKNAEIVLGKARRGYPTQAKAKDVFGKTHYFMVEPLNPEDTFKRGDMVRLTGRDRGRYYATKQ